jgi:acetylornithine deacetylase/succinyl-diaminopimelate desuccinylase-like protein
MFRVGGEPPILCDFLASERDSVLDGPACRCWNGSGPARPVMSPVSAAGTGTTAVKTIVPAAARLKVTFRLVADQSPEDVAETFEAWARDQIPDGLELDIRRDIVQGPALTPTDHPAVAALARSITRVWGAEPHYTRSGGSGPEEVLGELWRELAALA